MKRKRRRQTLIAVAALLGLLCLRRLTQGGKSQQLQQLYSNYGGNNLLWRTFEESESANNQSVNNSDSPASSATTSSSKNKIKMVAFTDSKFVLLARMWHDRMTDLGYQEQVIIATDRTTYEALSREGYNVELWEVDAVVNPDEVGVVQDSKLLRSLWLRRLEYLLEQALVNNSILLTDLDVIYSRHVPLERFENSEYDIFHALGKKNPNRIHYPEDMFPFVINAGLSYFKANSRTAQMLREIVNRCTNLTADSVSLSQTDFNHCDDQYEMNYYYANHAKFEVRDDTGYGNEARVGYVAQTGLKVLLWPRHFTWRDNMPRPGKKKKCPRSGWWTAMPVIRSDVRKKQCMFVIWKDVCGMPETKATTTKQSLPTNCTADELFPKLRGAKREA